MAGFPTEPPRFVGRAEVMAAASAALAPKSGQTTVVFHGMAGGGKTACALELAYRHQRTFEALAFWSAPTDPEQFGDALRRLAVAWEAQLGDYGFAMVDKIATLASLENFLPRLRALLQDTGLLLVLDNLETLLTPEGGWRDPRWALLMDALISHDGESRVILTSRILPAGLDPNRVLIRPVHALSRDESVLLARELPHLRALLHNEPEPLQGTDTADPALGLRVLTLVQGHPKLLELADAAAADPTRLAAPSRLLLQALCRIEETDRYSVTLDRTWAELWRRLDQPGDPPPLAEAVAPLIAAALIAAEPADPSDPDTVVGYRIHPGIAEAIHAATPEPVTTAVNAALAAWWTAVACWGIEQEQAGQNTSSLVVRAGLAAAPYLMRQHAWNTAGSLLEQARLRDSYSPVTAQAVIPHCGASPRPPANPKTSVNSLPPLPWWIPAKPKPCSAAPTTKPPLAATTASPPPPLATWSFCCAIRASCPRHSLSQTRPSSTPPRPGSGPGPNWAIKASDCRFSACSATTSRFSPIFPNCGSAWPSYPTRPPATIPSAHGTYGK